LEMELQQKIVDLLVSMLQVPVQMAQTPLR
jgi:hypothetical protein